MFTQIVLKALPCFRFSTDAVYNSAEAGTQEDFKVEQFPSGQNFVINYVKASFVCSPPYSDLYSSTQLHPLVLTIDVTVYKYITQSKQIVCSKLR